MEKSVAKLIAMALEEDFGEAGDVTSAAVFADETGRAALLSKDTGVLAGAGVFSAVFQAVDPEVRVTFHIEDGATLTPGVEVASLEGRIRSLLGGERTALNFLSFMSGIATRTRRFAEEARRLGTTIILDTRKTLPGYRAISKYAVRVGGGRNHRLGLYDMALVKDNHADAAGSLAAAVERVRRRWRKAYRIETECRNLAEVRQALDLGVDVIMLDNMTPALIAEALALIGGRIPVEISGKVRFPDLERLVPLGAQYISVGALTHSVEAFDFSLEVKVP